MFKNKVNSNKSPSRSSNMDLLSVVAEEIKSADSDDQYESKEKN